MANKKARVLVAAVIGGKQFKPNDVVSAPESVIKAHAAELDSHKDAVAYALEQNGGAVTEYAAPDEAEVTEATTEEPVAQ